jgi:membrane-associated protein
MSTLLPSFLAQYGGFTYVLLFLLIFIETGIVIFPFLPGDSLLFLCGSLAAMAGHPLSLPLLWLILTAAAVAGDALNFEIGEHGGHYLTTQSPLKRFIKPSYLQQSEQFFAKHGKAAIFLGRFMPIIRTFIPFTAGVSKMHFRSFVSYNIIGAVSWVTIGLGAGYLFGNVPVVKNHFELIILAVVLVSLLPAAILALKHKGGAQNED